MIMGSYIYDYKEYPEDYGQQFYLLAFLWNVCKIFEFITTRSVDQK